MCSIPGGRPRPKLGLNQAKQSIEMLEMLKAKTLNNLSEDENSALNTLLTEVRLNYIDELNKN